MPSLKAYTDESDKTGFYILANVGGAHPVTLQVTDLGAQILQKAGYEAEDDVPTKVVWSMFDVGILYTSSTINSPPEVTQGASKIFEELGVNNNLTENEKQQLLRYLEEYDGPNKAQVATLKERLNEGRESDHTERLPPEVEEDLERLAHLHDAGKLKTAEYEVLKSMALNDVNIDTDTAPETIPRREPSDSHVSLDEVTLDVRNWMDSQELSDLIAAHRRVHTHNNIDAILIDMPYPKHDNPPSVASFRDISFGYSFNELTEEEESRLRELWHENPDYELNKTVGGENPYLELVFRRAPSSESDMGDEDIIDEINHFFRAVCHIYDVTPAKLADTDMSWKHP